MELNDFGTSHVELESWWDRRLRFEVRIVATVAYIVSSFSFPEELSYVSPVEAVSSMISSEFMSGLLVELNMGKAGMFVDGELDDVIAEMP